ncbi:MAG: response regulator [Desulfobacteraceae bacterium]|nr:response regulator [Desulfobacteraceae bacterium]
MNQASNIRQKILITDDKPDNLYTLEQVLQETGAEIIKALSGNEALTASLDHEFALAILDVQMPGMDGYELAENLRNKEKTRHLPIIFLSAVYSDKPHVFRGYESGGVDFITKPYLMEILLSKVSVFLQLDRQRLALKKANKELEGLVKKRTAELLEKNRQLEQEIKERRQSEKALQAERKKFFFTLENIPAFVYLQARDYTIRYANKTFRNIFGDPDDKFCYEVIRGRDKPCEPCPTFEVFKTKQRQVWEWKRDNNDIYMICDNYVADTDGSPLVLKMGADISEIKRTEDALYEQKQFIKHVLDSSLNGIYIYNQQLGRNDFINLQYTRLTGYNIDEINNMNPQQFGDLFHPEDQARVFEHMEKVVNAKDGDILEIEYRFRTKSGTWIWCLSWDSVFSRNEHGQVVQFVGSFIDITKRRQTEDDLKKTAEELKHSNKELERFVYVASHDLQEPLRMVSSYVQLLEKRYKGKLDADADEFIGFASEGAVRIHMLINDLLAFSSVGTRGESFKPVETENVLEQTLADLRTTARESSATVTHDTLPTVMGDSSLLIQVFQNLISNAIKFRGKERPCIHITAEKKDREWQFSFRDNSIGIAPEYHDRIFVIFQRLHTRDKYPGTGMGLAICKKIVECHGGHIWVESQEGIGSVFYFKYLIIYFVPF